MAAPQPLVQAVLGDECRRSCLTALKGRYRDFAIEEIAGQGGCSYTLKLTRPPHVKDFGEFDRTFIVQIRPCRYIISMDVAATAREWYGDLAPLVTELETGHVESNDTMVMYRMSYLPGWRLDRLLPNTAGERDDGMLTKHRNLLDDLASFYATAWNTGMHHERSGRRSACDGRVGSTLLFRLEHLQTALPSTHLRSIAQTAKRDVKEGGLGRLPIVLTHGDLLPSNVLVDDKTWRINGLIDWAESEHLPFGLSLYGLEHLLGCLSASPSGSRFQYFPTASKLRQYFWSRVVASIPTLNNPELRKATVLARTVGILLWHGFAWDDGRIDRAVDAARDEKEVAYLEAFLNVDIGWHQARL